MSDWNREFNAILGERRNGLQACDLSEDDIAEIDALRDDGLTPEEAFDVFEEVEEVE